MADEQLRLQREAPNRIERISYPDQDSEEEEGEEPAHQVATIWKVLMIGLAVVFDLVSLFPGVNEGTVLISNMIFIPWFFLLGMNFTGKRIASLGVAGIAEIIPFISIFPMITINVVFCLYSSNKK